MEDSEVFFFPILTRLHVMFKPMAYLGREQCEHFGMLLSSMAWHEGHNSSKTFKKRTFVVSLTCISLHFYAWKLRSGNWRLYIIAQI